MIPAQLILGISGGVAHADENRRGPDNSYFVGTYELTGRGPGAGGQSYSGWAVIRDEGKQLSVTRCIGGKSETGHLAYEEWGPDRLIFLNGSLWAGHGASCEFANDNENYPRLACYTYPLGDNPTKTPGIEFYIHARWPKPDHAKGCEE